MSALNWPRSGGLHAKICNKIFHLPWHDLIIPSSYKHISKFRKRVTCGAALHLEKCCSLRIYSSLIWKTIGGETETNCGLMSLFSCVCAKVFAVFMCIAPVCFDPGPHWPDYYCLHAVQRDGTYKSKWAIEPLNGRWGKRDAGLFPDLFGSDHWPSSFPSL